MRTIKNRYVSTRHIYDQNPKIRRKKRFEFGYFFGSLEEKPEKKIKKPKKKHQRRHENPRISTPGQQIFNQIPAILPNLPSARAGKTMLYQGLSNLPKN
jgi:hypothetical protein